MGLIRKNTKFLFILVLPVYFFIVQSSITNKHTHFYANGMVITHSHPFQKNGSETPENHKHSKTEICFYSNFHFDYYNFTPGLDLKEINPSFYQKYLVSDEKIIYLSFPLQETLRGPPVFQT